jgi:hypothetical protein
MYATISMEDWMDMEEKERKRPRESCWRVLSPWAPIPQAASVNANFVPGIFQIRRHS